MPCCTNEKTGSVTNHCSRFNTLRQWAGRPSFSPTTSVSLWTISGKFSMEAPLLISGASGFCAYRNLCLFCGLPPLAPCHQTLVYYSFGFHKDLRSRAPGKRLCRRLWHLIRTVRRQRSHDEGSSRSSEVLATASVCVWVLDVDFPLGGVQAPCGIRQLDGGARAGGHSAHHPRAKNRPSSSGNSFSGRGANAALLHDQRRTRRAWIARNRSRSRSTPGESAP